MNDNKGVAQNVSFSSGNIELYEYIIKLVNQKNSRFSSFSDAVMDAIACHREITQRHGDWRTMDKKPPWLDSILERLKNAQIVPSDGSQDDRVKQAMKIDEESLFE